MSRILPRTEPLISTAASASATGVYINGEGFEETGAEGIFEQGGFTPVANARVFEVIKKIFERISDLQVELPAIARAAASKPA